MFYSAGVQPRHDRGLLIAAIGVVGLAAAVRLGRLPIAWDYWAIDYISYPYGLRDDLANGLFPWSRLVGQHPGQWGLAASSILAGGGSIATLYALSLTLSVGAIALGMAWLKGVAGWIPALLFGVLAALSPYLAHYGLELNNYPVFGLGAAMACLGVQGSWGCSGKDRSLWLALTAVGAAVAMHGHLAAVATLGGLGLLTLATKQWRSAAALTVGGATSVPVLLALIDHHGVEENIHNAALPPTVWMGELSAAFVGRFGPGWSFALLAGATVAAGVAAARASDAPGTRRTLITAVVAGAAGAASIVYAQVSGAGFVAQTPYWVHVTWCQLVVVALGFEAGGTRVRIGLAVVLAPWLALAGLRALAPLSGADGVEGAGDPVALRGYLDTSFSEGDVLVYAWDVRYLNDHPRGADPLMAAIRPSEVGDWMPRAHPMPGYCHTFRGGTACWLNSTGLRADDQSERLRAATRQWLGEGRTVHLVSAWTDPDREDPSDGGAFEALGGTVEHGWAGTARITRLTR